MEDWTCIIIGGVVLLIIVLKAIFGDDDSHDYGGLGEFRSRVRQTTVTSDDGEVFPVLEFEVIGYMPNSYDQEELSIYVTLTDATDPNDQSIVLTTIDWQSEEDTIVFLHKSELGPVPTDAGATDWMSIGVAPIDCTLFPSRGHRRFNAMFSLWPTQVDPQFEYGAPQQTDSVYAVHECTFGFFVAEDGYLERGENIRQARKHAIALAMCMSAADGFLDQSELNIITEWVDKMASMEVESDRGEFKREFKQIVDQSYQSALGGTLSMQAAIDGMNTCAQDTEKFEAVELILDVMAADGSADQSELTMLDNVTACLQLDPNQVRTLRDKRIASADTITLDKSDLKSLVGINDSMNQDEIRKHLNKEFQKWNSRATSGDESARKRASEMLDNIAEARRLYLS